MSDDLIFNEEDKLARILENVQQLRDNLKKINNSKKRCF